MQLITEMSRKCPYRKTNETKTRHNIHNRMFGPHRSIYRPGINRVQPGRIGHLHTHSIRHSTADLRTVGGLDQVANNYYTLKQGTLLFATVHKLTGLITVLRLLVQGGWIGQREGFIRLPSGSIGQFFFVCDVEASLVITFFGHCL